MLSKSDGTIAAINACVSVPIKALAAATVLLAVSSVAAQDRARYKLEDGSVRFQCKGAELAVPAWGKFSAVRSTILFDPRRPRATRGDVHVLLSSIVSQDLGWDRMFRGAAFLEIEDFPQSSFRLKTVVATQALQPGKWSFVKLVGTFTLHGQSRELEMPATVRWTPADPHKSKPASVAIHASFPISWEHYEIRVPRGNTRKFTGDGAQVQVHLRYTRKPSLKRSTKGN